MIQLVAYMIAVYGIARLIQTTGEAKQTALGQYFGILGVIALILLAVGVWFKGNEIAGLAAGF